MLRQHGELFMTAVLADLDVWMDGVELPRSYDGVSPKAAALETVLLSKTKLVDPADREQYVRSSASSGLFPLHGSAEELAEARGLLQGAGFTEPEIILICGSGPTSTPHCPR